MTSKYETDLYETLYPFGTIHMHILSDSQTYWINQKQLQELFQIRPEEMRLLIKKVIYNNPELKNCHCKRIPIIQYRKAVDCDEYNEWIVKTSHYDLVFFKSLYQLYPKKEASEFMLFARRNNMKKVCVIGSCVCDIIVEVPTLPKKQQDINIIKQSMTPGGCAYNIAHMLSLYDIPYTLFAPVGSGMFGDFVYEHLQKEHISISIPRVQGENGCCYCLVEEDGERTFLSHHGVEYCFQKEWFSLLNQKDYDTYYICGLELEEASGDILVEYLESLTDKTIYFAPGPRFQNIDTTLMDRMFSLSCILHVNEDEAQRMSGKESYQDAAQHLYSKTKNTIIITRGAHGAYLRSQEECMEVDSFPTSIIDTIGAGDGHLGAFIAEQKLGNSKEVSLQHANRVASKVLQCEGSSLTDEQFKTIEM